MQNTIAFTVLQSMSIIWPQKHLEKFEDTKGVIRAVNRRTDNIMA